MARSGPRFHSPGTTLPGRAARPLVPEPVGLDRGDGPLCGRPGPAWRPGRQTPSADMHVARGPPGQQVSPGSSPCPPLRGLPAGGVPSPGSGGSRAASLLPSASGSRLLCPDVPLPTRGARTAPPGHTHPPCWRPSAPQPGRLPGPCTRPPGRGHSSLTHGSPAQPGVWPAARLSPPPCPRIPRRVPASWRALSARTGHDHPALRWRHERQSMERLTQVSPGQQVPGLGFGPGRSAAGQVAFAQSFAGVSGTSPFQPQMGKGSPLRPRRRMACVESRSQPSIGGTRNVVLNEAADATPRLRKGASMRPDSGFFLGALPPSPSVEPATVGLFSSLKRAGRQ